MNCQETIDAFMVQLPTEDDIRFLLSFYSSDDSDNPFFEQVLAFFEGPSSQAERLIGTQSLPHFSGEVLAGYYQADAEPPDRVSKIDFYLQERLYQYWMQCAREEFVRTPCNVQHLRYCMNFALSTAKNPLQSGYHYNGALVEAEALEVQINAQISDFLGMQLPNTMRLMRDAFGDWMTLYLGTPRIDL